MLGDPYIVALLDLENPIDLVKVKRIMELTRNKSVETKVIENDLKDKFNIDNIKEIRAILYKMEETSLIKVEKKKVNDGYYTKWFYSYVENQAREARLMSDAISVEMGKVEKVKQRFSEHDYMFYCDNRCSPKLYSYEQMYDLKGKCAICGEGALLMLSDEDKSRSLKAFTFNLKPFIDKRAVMIDLFTTIFPGDPDYLDVAMKELYEYSVTPVEVDFPPPIDIQEALHLLSFVDIEPFDDAIFVDSPAVSMLPVNDILAMNDDELMHECMRRWIIATRFVYDHLLELSTQRQSRLRSFTMKKFFFCDTMGKKYISRALVGKPDKQVMSRLRDTFSSFQNAGYFKIMSYHPKFVTKGVSRFMEMCIVGEVYYYEEHKEDILDALDAFMEKNKGSRSVIFKESRINNSEVSIAIDAVKTRDLNNFVSEARNRVVSTPSASMKMTRVPVARCGTDDFDGMVGNVKPVKL